jgi:hypothetical protein
MRRLAAALLPGLLLALLLPLPAFAHQLATDNQMGVVMHIDPQDDPIAGKPATIFLEFKDKSTAFTLSDCDCKLAVSANNTQLYAENLLQSGTGSNASEASVSYTFPQRDAYAITVSGTPLRGVQFQQFSVTFNVRVDRGAGAAAKSRGALLPVAVFGIICAAFVVLLGYAAVRNRSRPAPPIKKSKE